MANTEWFIIVHTMSKLLDINNFCPYSFEISISDRDNFRLNIISKFVTDFYYEWLQRHLVSNRVSVGGGNSVPAFSLIHIYI